MEIKVWMCTGCGEMGNGQLGRGGIHVWKRLRRAEAVEEMR